MKKTLFSFLFLFTLLFLFSCKHTVNFDDYPMVSFTNDIHPIIVGNCTQSGCHGNTQSESFMLLTYDDVIKHGEIEADNPDKSKLYFVIKSYNSEIVMPRPPFNQLSSEQIKKIYLWIGQGAKNN